MRQAIRKTVGDVRHATSVRRAPRVLTKEELRRHLLALILTAVLVWYTFVVPANAPAKSNTSRTPGEGERGGEVRLSDSVSDAGDPDAADDFPSVPTDELDWPEYIYPN